MKAQKVFKNILRILVFAGMMCILPVFSDEVKADDPDVIVYQSDGITPAVRGESEESGEYYIGTVYGKNYLCLKSNDLIIGHSDYPIKDICDAEGLHTYTIRNLDIKANSAGGFALNFAINSNDVRLYVDGNCTISGQGMGSTTGISSQGVLEILPKPGGGSHSLTIQEVTEGISFTDNENASLILGNGNGNINIEISSKLALSGASNAENMGYLKINKGVSLNCSGGENVPDGCALVDNFSRYDINGTVNLKCDCVNESYYSGAIKLYGNSDDSFKVGPYADIYLTSKGKAAVVNTIPKKLDKVALGVTILGSQRDNVENPTEPVIITAYEYPNNGYSMIDGGGDTYAQSVRIRNVSPVIIDHDTFKSKSSETIPVIIDYHTFKSESSETIPVIVDYDTFKSEAPPKTVIATDNIGSQTFFDLKVHSADDKTLTNQKLLVQYLVRQNANIILTQGIYPGRDLSAAENGSLKVLMWNNLPGNQAGPVYAVVYNQTDGAYVLNGTLDAEGTAVFTGFKLRPASTVTICK